MIQWKKNLYISWCTQVLSLTGFGFMVPFLPLYIQELGVTNENNLRLWVGLLTAVPGLAMGVMAPFWGFLSDKIGRKPMILRAMAFGSLIVGLMAVAPNVQTVFALRLAQGMLTGTITASATIIAAGTPGSNLSSALGLLSSSTFIGLSFGPFVGGVVAELLGFRISFIVGSIILFVAFILVLIFINEPQSTTSLIEPKRVRLSFRILTKMPYKVLFIAIFLERFSSMMPQNFIPLYVQQLREIPKGVSAITGTISAAAGLVTGLSCLTLVRLGDRYNKTTLISILIGAAAATAFPIFIYKNLVWFSVFYLISIYFLGAISPLLQSQVSALTHPGKRGVILGLQTATGCLGWFLSPLLGSVVAIYTDLNYIFLFFSVSLFTAFGILTLLRLSDK